MARIVTVKRTVDDRKRPVRLLVVVDPDRYAARLPAERARLRRGLVREVKQFIDEVKP